MGWPALILKLTTLGGVGWGDVGWGGVVWAGYNQPSFLFHLRSRGMQCAFCFGSPWMDRCVFQVLTNRTTHFRSYLSSNSWTVFFLRK